MPGAGIPLLSAEPEFCVVSRRNDSLGSRWRWRVYASLCILSLGLALGFAALGAWMVLPCSALEMRTRREFNRYWTRVEVEEGAFNHPPRLKLWFAGQGVSFGDELPTLERAIVARDLRRVLAAR
jgi:uncharacterized membrane protein